MLNIDHVKIRSIVKAAITLKGSIVYRCNLCYDRLRRSPKTFIEYECRIPSNRRYSSGLAEIQERHDVAIYWPQNIRAIAAVLRTGKCPSWAVPRKLRVPGGLVALVDESGQVLLVFRVATTEERVPVRMPDGKLREKGCVLVARKGTVRTPGSRDPKMLNVNRHAYGAFAYFDGITYRRVIYELGPNNAKLKETALPSHNSFPSRRYSLFANNIGKTLSQPERSLIQAYVSWIGDISMFVHHPLKEAGLYTDLFIPRCWTLFEAKSSVARWVLREAVGQLFDYQRYYTRSPRLAVLLPERPLPTVMGLFDRKRIIVVWRARGGAFRDSANGVLTKDLRAV